jgi:hypothetical protein
METQLHLCPILQPSHSTDLEEQLLNLSCVIPVTLHNVTQREVRICSKEMTNGGIYTYIA